MDPNNLNADGQPFNLAFNAARRTERDLSELVGLARGLLFDGVVTEVEAERLLAWGQLRPDALVHWPTNVLFQRLQRMFADGRIDEDERLELKGLLEAVVGGNESVLLGELRATTLPLDAPPPLICWKDEVYVFTGRFAHGTRRGCERQVTDRGGSCEENVTRRTSFLVIGTFGSRDWVHSSYGRKILRAVELRDSGFGLRIVGEDHWAKALTPAGV